MDKINLVSDKTVDFESSPVPDSEDQPVKVVDENWKRYEESAWWWGWYN
ncbi:hypothetical protein [Paenibacillus cremeus]|nr:hypothetical protein [Paenibacillus cremeus]